MDRVTKTSNSWFLAAAAGVVISLSGLIWDAQIHILEHGYLAVEPLINLSEPATTNPGHLVFGAGFLLTIASVLAGFTMTWMQTRRLTGGRLVWHDLGLPLALCVVLAAIGAVAVYTLGQVG